VAIVGALVGLGYIHASRNEPVTSIETPLYPTKQTVEQDATKHADTYVPVAPANPATTETQTESSQPVGVEQIARWIADTRSNDPGTRAAAIAALANAPKAQAVPALERVLESGEPQVDRQIALRSLHALALNDGDHDNAIRDVIRRAMYHSDDENVTQTAQALLEDIEAAIADRAGD
jgi:HEAT repeat protein